ncbi:MAG: insulinase family protein [Defluviitaleaceae bacterium]|nr:insulinase family protein [Defluviitaleaceae bacterium]
MHTKAVNQITTIKTEKFKTTVIKVSFKAALKRSTVTERILLAGVLRNSSQKFASRKALSAHLEDLYGASLSISAKKQGKLHVINFYIQIANEKFLKSAPPLFEEALKTLTEVIMAPRLIDGTFDQDVVHFEKRLLKEDIESIYDDKTSYALRKMIGIMCEQENFGTSGDGYIEDLSQLDETTLVTTYESMLNHDEVSIVVVGDVEHEHVGHLFERHFNLKAQRPPQLSVIDQEEKNMRSVTVLKETQALNQTKLNIGYRTYTRVTDADYFAILVFNGVFGAFSHSKLFMNVREKESLCYYCAAQLDNFKGLMYVYSGLDVDQVAKAIHIIDQQLTDVCEGRFTAEELMLAKKSIINSKRESLDSASGMLSDLEMSALLTLTAAEFVEKIEQVTAADVSRVAQKIEKDTVFTLEPSKSNTTHP